MKSKHFLITKHSACGVEACLSLAQVQCCLCSVRDRGCFQVGRVVSVLQQGVEASPNCCLMLLLHCSHVVLEKPNAHCFVFDTLDSNSQALSMFSAALASGQLGPLMSQFGLPAEAIDAANKGGMYQCCWNVMNWWDLLFELLLWLFFWSFCFVLFCFFWCCS